MLIVCIVIIVLRIIIIYHTIIPFVITFGTLVTHTIMICAFTATIGTCYIKSLRTYVTQYAEIMLYENAFVKKVVDIHNVSVFDCFTIL